MDTASVGVGGPKQRGGQEGPNVGVHVVEGASVNHHVGSRSQAHHCTADLVSLGGAYERSHGGGLIGRIPYPDLGQRAGQSVSHRVDLRDGDQGATDGRALLAGLDGHFTDHLGGKQVELSGIRGSRRAQDRCV